MIGNSDDEANFPHKLLLTNRKVANLRKAFANHIYNLPGKIKDGAYVINLDELSDIGTHWIALYVNNKTVTYFDSIGVEHIPPKNLLIMKT